MVSVPFYFCLLCGRCLFLSRGPLLPSPAFFHNLACAPDRQRVLGNVVRNTRCGPHIRSLADAHWCYQCAIAADEYSILDYGFVFMDAIVVAGDRSCPDVYARADLGVSQIREVIRL